MQRVYISAYGTVAFVSIIPVIAFGFSWLTLSTILVLVLEPLAIVKMIECDSGPRGPLPPTN